MEHRKLGKTLFPVSQISLGTWQVGGKWGQPFSHQNADQILHAAIDAGVNFIDTADVYGGGESEVAVGRVVRSRSERVFVATKCGRQLVPHTAEAYTEEALRQFVEDSLRRTGLECLDLIQLHCPPTEVYYRPDIFGLFDRLKEEGKIRHFGVSVEKVEEGLKAIEYPNVETVQIIFNMFRLRPAEMFFQLASSRHVGVIVRVPLASGLLSGRFTEQTRFDSGDHRHNNRDGKHFDRGETFSGVPYELGISAVEELKQIFGEEVPLAAIALRWVLMFPAVSTVIPGASRLEQVMPNVEAGNLPDLTEEQMEKVDWLYNQKIRPYVHHFW